MSNSNDWTDESIMQLGNLHTNLRQACITIPVTVQSRVTESHVVCRGPLYCIAPSKLSNMEEQGMGECINHLNAIITYWWNEKREKYNGPVQKGANHIPKAISIRFLGGSRSTIPFFWRFKKPDLKELCIQKG